FTVRDLWKMCSDYGTVVDVFIPFKRSKSGKRFAFVSFIKRGSQSHVTPKSTKPALVLDETCIKEFDFGMSLMGREKDISVIPNLSCIISKEGFQNVKLSYLGGMWVLFEFDSLASKEKFLNHSDAWFPNFQEDDQDDLSSDGESQEGDVTNKVDNNESDIDRLSKSSFMHENDTAHKDVNICKKGEVGSHSEDPFNIYGILDGQKNNVCNSCSDEPKFPSGFTPDNNVQEKKTWKKISKILMNVFNLSQINSMIVVRTVDFYHNEDYLCTFIDRWEGDTVIMGDFNEVCSEHERFGSTFNRQGAIAFNNFISSACLIDLPLEGYAFT
nr:RNA-directed DNA polymerase, eukaryota, nucleotide-binding alpha-beta plait domain protein [Tanacetum cinerariifolium]